MQTKRKACDPGKDAGQFPTIDAYSCTIGYIANRITALENRQKAQPQPSSGAYAPSESRSAACALPVSAPFALDTAGSSITVPFDVNGGKVDAKRWLMIGVDVPHAADFPVVKDVRLHVRLLRVRVVYDDRGTQVPIETDDTETIIANNTGKPRPRADSTVCRLHLYAGGDKESNLSVCGFYARRDGHYIAEISTIEPMLADKQRALRVTCACQVARNARHLRLPQPAGPPGYLRDEQLTT